MTKPEKDITLLPVSWYTGIFSLILPAILAFYALNKKDDSWSWMYVFVKAAQFLGICKYISDDYAYAINYGFQNNYYSLRRLISLVSFLVIDAILIVVFFIYQRKRKDINADNSSCER